MSEGPVAEGNKEVVPSWGSVSYPPVFIVGCERSGTTLLRLMLDSHPDLAIPPESLFIPRAWEVRHRYRSRQGFDAERMLKDVFSSRRVQEWGLSEEVVFERVRALEVPDFSAVVSTIFATYAHNQGKGRWGDKTPSYLVALPLLAELFPSARFVHLIRDGRNVALSLWRAPFGPRSLSRAANRWAHQIRKGRAYGHALGVRRYLEVRYENLVAQPEATLSKICSFIDLDYRSEMLSYSERFEEAVPVRVRSHLLNLRKPPISGLRDWRNEMTPSELAVVEAIQARELEDLGYERTFSKIPLPAQARMLAVKVSVSARRVYFALERKAFIVTHRQALPYPRSW